MALENGAAALHLFARRPQLASVPISRLRVYPRAYDNYRQLPDAVRWHQAFRFRQAGSMPTLDAIQRAAVFKHFHLHLETSWHGADVADGQVVAYAADGKFRFDHVIAGTGYFVDPSARPEVGGFADRILLWRDRYVPPAEEEDTFVGSHPYLGEAHEYQEKVPGSVLSCVISMRTIRLGSSALACPLATSPACGATSHWLPSASAATFPGWPGPA